VVERVFGLVRLGGVISVSLWKGEGDSGKVCSGLGVSLGGELGWW
jgi:hypothetical protein